MSAGSADRRIESTSYAGNNMLGSTIVSGLTVSTLWFGCPCCTTSFSAVVPLNVVWTEKPDPFTVPSTDSSDGFQSSLYRTSTRRAVTSNGGDRRLDPVTTHPSAVLRIALSTVPIAVPRM